MPRVNLPRSSINAHHWADGSCARVSLHGARANPISAGAALGLPHIRETTAQAQIGAFRAGSLLRAPAAVPSQSPKSAAVVGADIGPTVRQPARMSIKANSLSHVRDHCCHRQLLPCIIYSGGHLLALLSNSGSNCHLDDELSKR